MMPIFDQELWLAFSRVPVPPWSHVTLHEIWDGLVLSDLEPIEIEGDNTGENGAFKQQDEDYMMCTVPFANQMSSSPKMTSSTSSVLLIGAVLKGSY